MNKELQHSVMLGKKTWEKFQWIMPINKSKHCMTITQTSQEERGMEGEQSSWL